VEGSEEGGDEADEGEDGDDGGVEPVDVLVPIVEGEGQVADVRLGLEVDGELVNVDQVSIVGHHPVRSGLWALVGIPLDEFDEDGDEDAESIEWSSK